MRRSRVAAEIEAAHIEVERIASEKAIRRSRIEAEIAAEKVATDLVLRRARIEAEIATD